MLAKPLAGFTRTTIQPFICPAHGTTWLAGRCLQCHGERIARENEQRSMLGDSSRTRRAKMISKDRKVEQSMKKMTEGA